MPTEEESQHVDTSELESSDESSSASGSSEAEEEEEEENYEEEEEKAAARHARAVASTHSLNRTTRKAVEREILAATREATKKTREVVRSAARATGHKSLSGIRGALDAQPKQKARTEQLAKEVGRLKADRTKGKVDAMIARAVKQGRVTPAEKESLRSMGMRDPKWLRANLHARPKLVRVTDDNEAFVPREGTDGAPTAGMGMPTNAEQERMRAKMLQTMTPEQQEQFLANSEKLAKRNAKSSNGAPRI
jgi:hypothetical protein